jgi:hypothetical protein
MATTTTRTQGNGSGTRLDLLDQLSTPPIRRRRTVSRVLWTTGFAVVCGVVFAALYVSAGSKHPVLAIEQPVQQGAQITAADIGVAHVSTDPGISPVPAAQENTVIGQRASIPLEPGTLLTRADLSSGPLLGANQASVGLDLKPGQVPAGLQPGVAVLVIQTSAQSQSASASASPASQVIVENARVLSVVYPSANSGSSDEQVTLALPTDLASQVASLASAGEIAVAGLGPGSGS